LGAFSFKKTERIAKRADFEKLWRCGKKKHGDYFVIAYCPNRLGKSRLGVTVSKKVGCAVVRNRIKRLIREYFRLHKNVFHGTFDMNVIARAGAGDLSNPELNQALDGFLFEISEHRKKDESGILGPH
jgi:ribonuclease P protein component